MSNQVPSTSLPAANHAALLRRGLRLEYATCGWNIVGAAVILVAAYRAGSVALAGFGLDSLIEIFASVIVIWELTGSGSAQRQQRALRAIGAAFLFLAIYVLAQAGYTLFIGGHPGTSPLGIAWLVATFVAMLGLAWGKRQTGAALANPVLSTEARVTVIDAGLAAAVLSGLVLNAAGGWWWADPLAGLVIVYYGFKEGWAAWHHDV